MWIFVLTCIGEKANQYVNLTFLSAIVLVIGSVFSFIYPGYFVITWFDVEFRIDGLIKIIIGDMFLHLGMFLYNYYRYGFTSKRILESFVLLAIYGILVDIEELYHL
jgi:membrane protein CcdC involved in cytochrome C biogenesis